MVVVVGAGDLGGALVRTLARLDCVGRVLLVDPAPGVAAGKALDIAQAAAVEGFSTRVDGSNDLQMACGADVVVFADRAGAASALGDEWLSALEAERETGAVLVFAGVAAGAAIERAYRELRLSRRRLIGSAPTAYVSAVRALLAATTGRSPGDITLSITGRPPERGVIAWSSATMAGAQLEATIGPAAMAALRAQVRRLPPPGPYTLASAGARVVEAVVNGSRRRFCCSVVLDGEMGVRGRVAALSVPLGPAGVLEVPEPVLSPYERVAFDAAMDR
jgi:malate dehydrogenase